MRPISCSEIQALETIHLGCSAVPTYDIERRLVSLGLLRSTPSCVRITAAGRVCLATENSLGRGSV